MIERLVLKNFQKHEMLDLTFSNDINVITGLTAAGKSGIYRGMEWILNMSNISQKDFRREGTKETSGKIWLNNGFQIERIRTNSINRYILSKEGCDDKVFDSFGQNMPEEIADVLGFSSIDIDNEHVNLNFANQDQLNFLIDSTYSDTFKAKLFNKLTGNEVLDKVFKKLNSEHLQYKRDSKTLEQLIKKQEVDLSEYTLTHKTLKNKLCMVNEQYNKVKEDVEIYNHLKELCDKLKTNKENEEFIIFQKSKIKTISEDKLKDLKNEAELLIKLQVVSDKLQNVNDTIKANGITLKSLKQSDVDFSELIKQNETLQKLTQLQDLNASNLEKDQQNAVTIKEAKNKLQEVTEKLEKIWKECKTCPLCGMEKK